MSINNVQNTPVFRGCEGLSEEEKVRSYSPKRQMYRSDDEYGDEDELMNKVVDQINGNIDREQDEINKRLEEFRKKVFSNNEKLFQLMES